jgi:hypothetical protein
MLIVRRGCSELPTNSGILVLTSHKPVSGQSINFEKQFGNHKRVNRYQFSASAKSARPPANPRDHAVRFGLQGDSAVKNAVAIEQGVLDVDGEGSDQTGDPEANRPWGE